MSDSLRARVIALAPALALCVTIGIYLVAYEPLLDGHQHPIGPDYSVFVPRLLGNHYWFRLNGLFSMPWFTPAFCGGMPEWANPQGTPYSLPQWLVWFVDPVRAIQITFAVAAMAGATGTWMLLRRGFETSAPAALVGSVVFLFNGFFLSHLIVGHFPFYPFMLTPWIGWLLVQQRQSRRQLLGNAVVGGLLLSVMIHAGALTILLPVAGAWAVLALIRGLTHPDPSAFWARLIGMVVIAALLSASKLSAVGALAAHFGRDFYPLSGFDGIGSTLSAIFRGLFLTPRSVDELGYRRIAVRLGIHEGDYGISLVPLVLIAAALVFGRRPQWVGWKGRGGRLVAIALLLLLPVALNTYSPGWMAFLKHVPIIRQSSTLLRWFLVYIPVLAVLASLAVERLPMRGFFVAAGVVATVASSLMVDRSPYLEKTYSPMWVIKAWQDQKAGQPIPIIEKMELKLYNGHPQAVIGGDDVLTASASQVFCTEPLFGYFHEALPWKSLHDGPALDEVNGHLNVTNPACEMFPEQNHCKPGDTFLASQQIDAEAFLSWTPFPFQRSTTQRVADVVSLLSILGVIAHLIANRRRTA